MRNEQTRDHRRFWIDLDVDRQAPLAQSIQDLCEADRSRVGWVEAHSAFALQLHGEAGFAAQHFGEWAIERWLETYDGRDDRVRVRHRQLRESMVLPPSLTLTA